MCTNIVEFVKVCRRETDAVAAIMRPLYSLLYTAPTTPPPTPTPPTTGCALPVVHYRVCIALPVFHLVCIAGRVSGEDWCSLPPLFPGLTTQCNAQNTMQRTKYNATHKIQCNAQNTMHRTKYNATHKIQQNATNTMQWCIVQAFGAKVHTWVLRTAQKLGQFRSNAQNKLNWCRWHWMRTLIEKYFPGHFKWSSLQSIVFGITVEAIVLDRPSPVRIALLRDQRWRMRGEASLLCQGWPPQWGETHHRINKLIFSSKETSDQGEGRGQFIPRNGQNISNLGIVSWVLEPTMFVAPFHWVGGSFGKLCIFKGWLLSSGIFSSAPLVILE